MKKRITLSLLALLAVFLLYAAWKILGAATAFDKEQAFVYVGTGMRFDEFYAEMEKENILRDPAFFRQAAKFLNYPAKMKAGRFEIRANESLLSILRKLINGRQTPVNLTITKVRTREDLAALVGRKMECDSAAFFRFLESNDSLRSYGLDSNSAMTAVLPNTYNYFWNSPANRIFAKFFAEYKSYWTPERLRLAKERGLNPQSAYIIASLVEEETTRKEDKGKMASVYINRLQQNMKLAADPTIKYAMRNFELKRIYDQYLQVESPYNTYKYAGLPPGPICTPSLETLEAVIESPKTNFLYFVAKPDFSGYSNFAADFRQHLVNARAYQKALDEEMKKAADAKKGENK